MKHSALFATTCSLVFAALVQGADDQRPLAPVLQSFVDQHIAAGVVTLVANKDGVVALDKAGEEQKVMDGSFMKAAVAAFGKKQ